VPPRSRPAEKSRILFTKGGDQQGFVQITAKGEINVSVGGRMETGGHKSQRTEERGRTSVGAFVFRQHRSVARVPSLRFSALVTHARVICRLSRLESTPNTSPFRMCSHQNLAIIIKLYLCTDARDRRSCRTDSKTFRKKIYIYFNSMKFLYLILN